jgi:hypothetical protein
MSSSVAVLACFGLFSVLILWRAVVLDKADVARSAAAQPPIMQDAEQETSWNDRVADAVAYLCGELIMWAVAGILWCFFTAISPLFPSVPSPWIFIGIATISCGVLILALVVWRALKADTLDDPNGNPRANRLIYGDRERGRL